MIVETIRAFLKDRGYLEVFTPLLTIAPAPEPHIEHFKADDHYLISSPELNIKRLIADTGIKKAFQISPVFRKSERGKFHNPEFTMLEWYEVGRDYVDLMDQCEGLINYILSQIKDSSIPFTPAVMPPISCRRLSIKDAFSVASGWIPKSPVDEARFDKDLVEKIEPRLNEWGTGVFLYDWPKERASLARVKRDEQGDLVAERVEFYLNGIEVANGFSELIDPVEQRKRFLRDNTMGYPLPEEFLSSLARLPECAGMAIGIERLHMAIAGEDNIDNVLTFPFETA